MQGMATSPAPVADEAVAEVPRAKPYAVAPSRRGKRAFTGHIDEVAFKQLRLLKVELDRPIQSLLEEALNDLFRKYSKSAIV